MTEMAPLKSTAALKNQNILLFSKFAVYCCIYRQIDTRINR